MEFCYFGKTDPERPVYMLTSEQRPAGSEGKSHANIWESNVPEAKALAHAKAMKQRYWLVCRPVGRPILLRRGE